MLRTGHTTLTLARPGSISTATIKKARVNGARRNGEAGDATDDAKGARDGLLKL